MTVFISRELPTDSIFRRSLESKGLQVTGKGLLELRPLPFDGIPDCDWIFFSSKNAVRFFFQQQATLPSGLRWAAIGPGTAAALSRHQPIIDFTGTGDPEETAGLFAAKAEGQTVLFPAARHTRQGVQRHLPPSVRCVLLEVYDNRPAAHAQAREEDVLVFTSPMSAEAYFLSHSLQPRQRVIAIGQSTLDTLQKMGIPRATSAQHASETALAEAVLALLD